MKSQDLANLIDYDIKWSDSLKAKFLRENHLIFNEQYIVAMNYRPYLQKRYYCDKNLSDRLTSNHYKMFGNNLTSSNKTICFSGIGSSKPFSVLASKMLWSLDFIEKTQSIPLFVYNKGKRVANVTQWGLQRFREHYDDKRIDAEAIFHYVYAVLHNSDYRRKYMTNLTRDLPRIPFLDDFWQWAKWGEELMRLHLDYATLKPFKLERMEKNVQDKLRNKTKLKVDRKLGTIIIDEQTTLGGIPKEVWEYKIGNRSAVEWILDQYKEKIPKDPTIRAKFSKYKFQNYKEYVIDMLQRIVTISIETMRIIKAMEQIHC